MYDEQRGLREVERQL